MKTKLRYPPFKDIQDIDATEDEDGTDSEDKSLQPEVGRTNMMQTGGPELEDGNDAEAKSVQKRAARGLPGVQF